MFFFIFLFENNLVNCLKSCLFFRHFLKGFFKTFKQKWIQILNWINIFIWLCLNFIWKLYYHTPCFSKILSIFSVLNLYKHFSLSFFFSNFLHPNPIILMHFSYFQKPPITIKGLLKSSPPPNLLLSAPSHNCSCITKKRRCPPLHNMFLHSPALLIWLFLFCLAGPQAVRTEPYNSTSSSSSPTANDVTSSDLLLLASEETPTRAPKPVTKQGKKNVVKVKKGGNGTVDDSPWVTDCSEPLNKDISCSVNISEF